MAGFDTVQELGYAQPVEYAQPVAYSDEAYGYQPVAAPTTVSAEALPYTTAAYTDGSGLAYGGGGGLEPQPYPVTYSGYYPTMYTDPAQGQFPYGAASYGPTVSETYSYAPPVYSYGGAVNGAAGAPFAYPTAATSPFPYSYPYQYQSPVSRSYYTAPRVLPTNTASYGIQLKPANDNTEFALADPTTSVRPAAEAPVKRKRKKGCC